MKPDRLISALLAALALCAMLFTFIVVARWSPAFAQTPADGGAAQMSVPHVVPDAEAPTVQEGEHGARYISGGVSAEERVQMRELGRGFPLRITLAEAQGSLVAGVDVQISDAQGRPVVSAADAGPLLYVFLPAGRYTVNASNAGEMKSREVMVGRGKSHQLAFVW